MNEQHLKPDEIAMLERAEKATKGPWIEKVGGTAESGYQHVSIRPTCFGGETSWWVDEDVEFVCNARTDLPTILARLANERAKLAIAMDRLRVFEKFCEPDVAKAAAAAIARINELEKQS